MGNCFTYKRQPREGRGGLGGRCLAQRPAPGGTGKVAGLGGEADTESREEEKDRGMPGHWHGCGDIPPPLPFHEYRGTEQPFRGC